MDPKKAKMNSGCRPASLLGFWAILPERFDEMFGIVMAADWAALGATFDLAEAERAEMNVPAPAADPKPQGPPPKPYAVRNGVAEILVSGPTTKYPTSFNELIGGTSTVLAARKLRAAVADPDVSAVMLHFEDAPGGTVAGSLEFRDAIRAAAKAKPLWAHGSDVIASASMIYGAAAQRLTANGNASVGSIGVRTHVDDTSERFAKEGVKRISIHAGKFKAVGLPGTPIDKEQIEYLQNNVDKLNDLFINSIVDDRKLSAEDVKAMEAKVFIGEDAKAKGLIDGVCSYEDALGEMIQKYGRQTPTQPPPHPQPGARMDLVKLAAMFGLPATATAEQVEAAINARNTELARLKAATPREPDPELMGQLLELAEGRIDLQVEKGNLPPTVAANLKTIAGVVKDGDNKPNAAVLTKSAAFGNKSPLDFVVGLFDGLKIDPQANTGGKASQKPEILNRTIPGADEGGEDENAKRMEAGRQAGAKAGGVLTGSSNGAAK